jgi:hypothetical protein
MDKLAGLIILALLVVVGLTGWYFPPPKNQASVDDFSVGVSNTTWHGGGVAPR